MINISSPKKELEGNLVSLLGGRAAEELVFEEVTTGASNDLERATGLAHRIVCQFGMSEALGPVTFRRGDDQVFLGRDISRQRDYSEEVAHQIDQEVRNLIEKNYKRSKDLLAENREKLDLLALTLLEREVMDAREVMEVTGLKDKLAKIEKFKDKPAEPSKEIKPEEKKETEEEKIDPSVNPGFSSV